jgi:hypothetical protein
VRKLPSGKTKQAPDLSNAILEAGVRYDRYNARKNDWLNYPTRRWRFEKISELAEGLASRLCELDILSRDDLESRFDKKQIEILVGSLHLLNEETKNLTAEVQKDGRPRDLAEERWIWELADIYENAFGQPARVWGSGAGSTNQRGRFYRLLELSRPTSFFRYGKLSLRQLERTLKKRDIERGRNLTIKDFNDILRSAAGSAEKIKI